MFYGANVWDPLMIISQIVALQCLCYLSLGLLQWMVIAPHHSGHVSILFIFDWHYLNLYSLNGWLTVATSIGNSFVCAGFLVPIVGRAKKCVDFASTLNIWHAIFTISSSGWPKSMVWWSVLGTNMAITSLLGEWLCLQREMRDIPLNNLRDRNRGASSATKAGSTVPRSVANTEASVPMLSRSAAGLTGILRTSSNPMAKSRGGAQSSRSASSSVSGPNAV
jgi:hypothetical protein